MQSENSIMKGKQTAVYFGTESISTLAPKLWELILSKMKSAKLLNILKKK